MIIYEPFRTVSYGAERFWSGQIPMRSTLKVAEQFPYRLDGAKAQNLLGFFEWHHWISRL